MHRHTKLFARLVFLLPLSLMLCSPALAQTNPTYQVEVIVFEHTSKQALLSEDWPTTVALPNTRNAINLSQQSDIDSTENFVQLPQRYFGLTKEADAINRKAGFKVLLHLAWRQPITRQTQTIHLYGGEGYNLTSPVNHGGFVDTNLQAQNWQLNGTLSLNRTNFINLKTNLVLAVPTQQIPRSVLGDYDRPLMYFQLKQTRRIRSNELNYFDHPLFGMLLVVTQVRPDSARLDE